MSVISMPWKHVRKANSQNHLRPSWNSQSQAPSSQWETSLTPQESSTSANITCPCRERLLICLVTPGRAWHPRLHHPRGRLLFRNIDNADPSCLLLKLSLSKAYSPPQWLLPCGKHIGRHFSEWWLTAVTLMPERQILNWKRREAGLPFLKFSLSSIKQNLYFDFCLVFLFVLNWI